MGIGHWFQPSTYGLGDWSNGAGALARPTSHQVTPELNAFTIDPAASGQGALAGLITKRGDYIEQSSAPYKSALFNTMSYGNPQLESQYNSAAIPQIQQSFRQASDITNRTAGATGVGIGGTDQRLMDRLSTLKQEETIAGAAKQIKQRLKERDMSAALGVSGAQNQIIEGAF